MLMTSSTGEVLCMCICYVTLFTFFLSKKTVSHPNVPNPAAAKGPVLHTAVIAGTQGAKKTSDLLPFCHPVKLDHCKVWFGCMVTIWLLSTSFVIGHHLNSASSGSCRTCEH